MFVLGVLVRIFWVISVMLFLPFMGQGASGSGLPQAVVDSDFREIDVKQARLGQLLFYDKILSGNRTIACATCHHPRLGTSDGQSLALGEGGIGLGDKRVFDPQNIPEQRIPRNSPALWNLGAREFIRLFHDGRLEEDPSRPYGLRSPLEDEMVVGFSSLLSAQNMFPVLSPDEMAGHYDENDISIMVRKGIITADGGAWDLLAARIDAIPQYRQLFDEAVPETKGRALEFADISNAIADFVAFEFRSDDTPFDAYLRGTGTLTPQALAGMDYFYGEAGCSACHLGKFQTDHDFHAMGSPQLGPGKGERFERHQRDIGRMRVSNDSEDIYAFRTPSLRNITLSAPYGHAGGHIDLKAFIIHHIDPVSGLKNYKPQAVLAPLDPAKADWAVYEEGQEYQAIADTVTQKPVVLFDKQLDDIVAFLQSLESPTAMAGRLGIPERVPSGLPVDR